MSTDFVLRTDLRPGDIGAIVRQHGITYAAERGFDPTFEAYVAEPLAVFVRQRTERECLWIAEDCDRFAGCIAIVAATPTVAQLRWFLVEPAMRGTGLGTRLLTEAVGFARRAGYGSIVLWTESALSAAASLYQKAGFRRTEVKAGRMWGVDLVEEKYELRYSDGAL